MEKKSFVNGLDSLLQSTVDNSTNKKEGKKRGRPQTNIREISKTSQEGTKEGETRATFIVQENLLEKLKALAFWERKQIKTMIKEALESYIGTRNESQVRQAEKAYRERVE